MKAKCEHVVCRWRRMMTITQVPLTLSQLDLSDLISMMARVSAQVHILLSKICPIFFPADCYAVYSWTAYP